MQVKIDLKHLLAAIAESEEAFYRELDLLADALAHAIPEYRIVLEHNPSTRQDYVLVERKEVTE